MGTAPFHELQYVLSATDRLLFISSLLLPYGIQSKILDIFITQGKKNLNLEQAKPYISVFPI